MGPSIALTHKVGPNPALRLFTSNNDRPHSKNLTTYRLLCKPMWHWYHFQLVSLFVLPNGFIRRSLKKYLNTNPQIKDSDYNTESNSYSFICIYYISSERLLSTDKFFFKIARIFTLPANCLLAIRERKLVKRNM